MGKYYVTIQSHLWNGDKEFNDFKSAIEYAKEMEAYYYGMLKYHHKGNTNITITVSSNTKAEEEYHIEIISKNNILTSTWYYNGEHKEKRREVLDSKLTVGDSIKFKDGRTGIIEDYDEKYFYVRDNNANTVKVSKCVKDEDENLSIKIINIFENNIIPLFKEYSPKYLELSKKYNKGSINEEDVNFASTEKRFKIGNNIDIEFFYGINHHEWSRGNRTYFLDLNCKLFIDYKVQNRSEILDNIYTYLKNNSWVSQHFNIERHGQDEIQLSHWDSTFF